MRRLSLILFIIAAIAMLVLYGFFVVGLSDGTVSAFNIGLWLMLLFGFTALVGGGWMLRARGRVGMATLILLPVAAPAAFFGLFLVIAILFPPRWN